MDKYQARIENLKKHLRENPHDYQAQIGLLKARSDAIDHDIYLKQVAKKKKIAEAKKILEERA